MRSHKRSLRSWVIAMFGLVIFLAAPGSSFGSPVNVQSNLASDIPGAANTDPNLKNPWGMSFAATSPFWVSNQGAGNSTLYNGAGAPQALIVSVGPFPPGPTGQQFVGASGFTEPNGKAALFAFDTLAGTVDAWTGGTGNVTADIVASTSGASFTGLALGTNGSGNFLYAADFAGNHIDVFNNTFGATTLAGSFTDPGALAGYGPYNIENIGGNLYVEYAQIGAAPPHKPVIGAGLGYVDVFDANGNFVKRLITGGPLNVPWGISLAPPNFGDFTGDLLVGNFGDGTINAFNPSTGAFLGTLRDSSGNPIVNSGLWAIKTRTGGPAVNTNALYFTAGINNEVDGLFGSITATPEPGTIAAGTIGLLLLFGYRARQNRKR